MPGVRVHVHIAELLADRHIELQAGGAASQALGGAAGGQDDADAWRDRGYSPALVVDLVTM